MESLRLSSCPDDDHTALRQAAFREFSRDGRCSAIDLDTVDVLRANLVDLHPDCRLTVHPDRGHAASAGRAVPAARHADARHEPNSHPLRHLDEANPGETTKRITWVRGVELLDVLLRDERADAAPPTLLVFVEEGMTLFFRFDFDGIQPEWLRLHHHAERVAFTIDHRDAHGADFIPESTEREIDDAIGDTLHR